MPGRQSGVASSGTSAVGTFTLLDWRAVNVAAAQTNVVFSRGTSQAQAAQLEQNCTLIGWTCSMDGLGGVNAAAGAALTIKAVRVSAAGVADAAVTLGTVDIGESNVAKNALTTIDFTAADSVYLTYTTPAGWTATTADPCITLIFRPR